MMIGDLWYKNVVIYNLDLETFMDSNGDGIGDFTGLMNRLDYLHSLGVGAVWLAPFQKTPNRDNGYDISDYYAIDPRHGSGGQFVEFIHQAKTRGIKVLIDLVVNHTSDQHPWFQSARQDEDSPYRHWYVWAKEKPKGSDKGLAFPGVQETTWTYDEVAEAYYFHRFYAFQPDLNIENPTVRAEIRRIIGYWLQLGIDGFRVDAVPFLLETQGKDEQEPDYKFEYLHEMRDFLQWRKGNAIMLGEANIRPDEMADYFGQKDEAIHMIFNFHVNQHLFYALATAETDTLIEALQATKNIPPESQWAQFLRNHDELSLDHLTEEQRQKVFAKFAPEAEMRLYGRGIRRRLAPMLGDMRRVKLANSALFSLPGTPVLRYGQEIGMGEDLALSERTAVRTPMQWSDEYQAGFSTAGELVHPVIEGGPYGYKRVNVESQRRDRDSLLNWMANMIRLRKECQEIGWGEWEILETGSKAVLAMRYDWSGSSLVILHNFADEPQPVMIVPGVKGGDTLVNLLKEERSQADDEGKHHIRLAPYDYGWYRVGSLNYILEREEHKQEQESDEEGSH